MEVGLWVSAQLDPDIEKTPVLNLDGVYFDPQPRISAPGIRHIRGVEYLFEEDDNIEIYERLEQRALAIDKELSERVKTIIECETYLHDNAVANFDSDL